MNSMTRQGEKKKKADNDKLNHMIVDVVTFLEAVKAKPSMWMDERLERLRDWHSFMCRCIRIFFLQWVHRMMYFVLIPGGRTQSHKRDSRKTVGSTTN
jgi:hypothetical protein